MDNHSKYVCLIGVLHFLGYFLYSLKTAIRLLESEGNDEEPIGNEPIFLLAHAAYLALMTVLAGLMIRGVIKQRHLLVAPFFVMSSVALSAGIIMFSIHLIMDFQESIYYFPESSYIMGVQIMALYPIGTLFMKLRSKYLKEQSLEYEAKSSEKLPPKLCV